MFKLHKLTIMNPIEEKRNLIFKKKSVDKTKDMWTCRESKKKLIKKT